MHGDAAVADLDVRPVAEPLIDRNRPPDRPLSGRQDRQGAVDRIHDQRVAVDHQVDTGVSASQA